MAEKVRVGLAIESQDAAAINNLIKFAKAQDKVGDSTKRVNREARDQGTQVGAMQGAWQKAITAMSGIASVAGLVRGAKAAVTELMEAWQKNQEAVDQNIASLTRFSAISTLTGADREMVLANVGHMEVAQAAQIAFSARSALFDDEAIKDVLKEASQAKQMGEDPELFARSLIALRQGVFGDRSVSQVSNFLATMAEKSPLTADQYAEQFTKVGGIAGATMEEKAAGGALMSALVKSMGADVSPEVASTAAKGFLVKRKTVGAEFLAGLGLEGKDVPTQIAALSRLAQSDAWTREQQITTASGTIEKTTMEKQFLAAFGERTAPALASLLRSPEALKRIAPDTAAGVEALAWQGKSMMARKVEQKTMQDPEWAMQQESAATGARRRASAVRRGFREAPVELAKQEMAAELEAEPLPILGDTGSWKLGLGARVGKEALRSPLTYTAAPGVGVTKQLFDALGEFAQAIMDNRAALEKNTQAMETGGPAVVDTGGTVE